ncbi:MAG: sulfotransferase domain-containing protein [Chloroflexi bacterium]|nr:sulfotransferase domain-containing protein [Chloroflexota bacterium]
MTRMPNLFIVGAPKSGTTSLYEWLRGHPEVFMSRFKEPCYFARDLAWETSGYYLRYGIDRQRYLALFDEAGTARRLGEASTRYLFSRDAPGLIKAETVDPRIVVMLRNPVDMAASLHAHKVASGTEDLTSFAEALSAEADRGQGRRIPRNSNPRLSTYRDRARFAEQLGPWLEAFGRGRVHVIILEQLVRNPAAGFRDLLEFLEVDSTYQPESFDAHNPAHGGRSGLLGAVARSRAVQFAVWRLLPLALGQVRTLTLTRRLVQSPLLRKRGDKPVVSPELRRRLEAELAPDVARLSDLLGQDLARIWFGRPDPVRAQLQVARE